MRASVARSGPAPICTSLDDIRAAAPEFGYLCLVDLTDAYRVLEISPGASKDEAREARNVLAKVWHPDRHHGDPKVHDRAADKLRQINEAYAVLETAMFPPRAVPQREAPPAYVDSLTHRPHATPPQTQVSDHDLTPRRRVRSWVPFVLGAIVAAGAISFVLYEKRDRGEPVVTVPTRPALTTPTPASAGFTVGSSREDVRKIMGEPTRIDQMFG